MFHVLTIAGSDSSGGAGIQADLKAFSAHGVYGMSVITAITAQNTQGVQAIQVLEPSMVEAQLEAVFSDIRVDAVKIGMLANRNIIETVSRILSKYKPKIVVLDPVMVSKSGHRLLAAEAEKSLSLLFPLVTLITPNLPEAALLSGLSDTENPEILARKISGQGVSAVLIKGGHSNDKKESIDLLFQNTGMKLFKAPRFEAKHTHGTGCSLSSAIAALAARGFSLDSAVEKAKAYVSLGIQHGIPLGKGCGPIHHFYALYGFKDEVLL